MKWLLRLYPSEWRRRYGEEFGALLEETGASPGVFADILLGALDAHRHGASPAVAGLASVELVAGSSSKGVPIVATRLPERSEIEHASTWDVAAVYPADAQWEEDFRTVESKLAAFSQYAGTLGASGARLFEALESESELSASLGQLSTYAQMRHDVDQANPEGQALVDRVMALAARVHAAQAFVAPELLALPVDRLQALRAEEPRLAVYNRFFDELIRQRDHIRSNEVETVLAELGQILDTAENVAELLRNADMRFPDVTDSDGTPLQLSEPAYRRLLEHSDRRVRHDAHESLMSTYGSFRNTIGGALAQSVRGNVVKAGIRRYGSAIEAALEPNEIPLAVYDNLVKSVRAQVPLLQRYLDLRRRALKLPDLHPYDLFVPIVAEESPRRYSFDEAVDLVLESLTPLGADYVATARTGMTTGRWVDVYPNRGKRSGAYSGGSYRTPPFMLLNFNGTLNDVFTLTHELGHSMHSFFTRQTQPYPTGRYTIFVAEVASTCNEQLLHHVLQERETDPKQRAVLLGRLLENFRGTIFRQTLFAEFEQRIHARAESGAALTAEVFSELYHELNHAYYEPAVTVDPVVDYEWARIPHFFFSFYVYQYATGLAAATALSQDLLTDSSAATRYREFLSSGNSADSLTLLKRAGVDLTTPEPIERAFKVFESALTELEKLLL
ncbi:MAG: oligoendopeptidase F [Chloroflexi bacterium]|nr:oligoendopeptidase F [Chloroflexota bacterium]